MTLRHIRIFLAVCENGCNITRAAEALYLAQPAVSQAVRELEDHYQVQLFDRLGRRLYITPAGEKMRQYALHIRQLFDEMETAVTGPEGRGVLRVGASITIGSQFLPHYARAFQAIAPDCTLRAEICTSARLEELLLSGQLDVALAEGLVHSPMLTADPYLEDELVGVCSASGPFEMNEEVEPERFAAQPILLREPGSGTREVFDHTMEQAGIAIQPAWQGMSTGALLHAVIQGLGVAVLPRRLVASNLQRGLVRLFSIRGLAFKRQFQIVLHRNKYITPPLSQFIELCRSYELDYPFPSLLPPR